MDVDLGEVIPAVQPVDVGADEQFSGIGQVGMDHYGRPSGKPVRVTRLGLPGTAPGAGLKSQLSPAGKLSR